VQPAVTISLAKFTRTLNCSDYSFKTRVHDVNIDERLLQKINDHLSDRVVDPLMRFEDLAGSGQLIVSDLLLSSTPFGFNGGEEERMVSSNDDGSNRNCLDQENRDARVIIFLSSHWRSHRRVTKEIIPIVSRFAPKLFKKGHLFSARRGAMQYPRQVMSESTSKSSAACYKSFAERMTRQLEFEFWRDVVSRARHKLITAVQPADLIRRRKRRRAFGFDKA